MGSPDNSKHQPQEAKSIFEQVPNGFETNFGPNRASTYPSALDALQNLGDPLQS